MCEAALATLRQIQRHWSRLLISLSPHFTNSLTNSQVTAVGRQPAKPRRSLTVIWANRSTMAGAVQELCYRLARLLFISSTLTRRPNWH
jgi:hypothetical protein